MAAGPDWRLNATAVTLNPSHSHIPSAVSVWSESSGLGQYLSVLEGTGALAGKERQTGQTTPWGL